LSEARGVERGTGLGEIRMIRNVKELGPELQVLLFAQFRSFQQREVDVRESRAINRVSSQIPESAGGGQRERGRIQTSIDRGTGGVLIHSGDRIRALVRQIAVPEGVAANEHRERDPGGGEAEGSTTPTADRAA